MNSFGQAYGNRIVPSNEPGVVFVEGAGFVKITDWQDTHVIDTELIPVGATPAGTVYNFFASQTFQLTGARKTLLDTNLTQQQMNPKGWTMLIGNICFTARPGTLFDDFQTIMASAYVRFLTGNDKIEREGLMTMFPSIYGLTGILHFETAGVAQEKSNSNNGTPAQNAIGKYMPIQVGDMQTFRAEVSFPVGMTLAAQTALVCYMRVNMQKPVR